MSRVETRTTTTVRHEYMIPKPAYRKDVYEAMAWADKAIRDAGIDCTFDDAFTVDSDDEHIIIYWEEKTA